MAMLLRLLLTEHWLGRLVAFPASVAPRPLDPQARTRGLGRSGEVWRRAAHHCKCRMRAAGCLAKSVGSGSPLWLPRRAHDQLLSRSFQAGGQPVCIQIRGRSHCPWVTAGDLSLPPVLARIWRGRPDQAADQKSGPAMARAGRIRPVLRYEQALAAVLAGYRPVPFAGVAARVAARRW